MSQTLIVNGNEASNQWNMRDHDERFWGPAEGAAAALAFQKSSREQTISWADLKLAQMSEFGGRAEDIGLMGPKKLPAILTYGAARQLHSRLQVPYSFNKDVPTALALKNLQFGLERRQQQGDEKDSTKLLLHSNGSTRVMALTGPDYQRMWDAPILNRLAELNEDGWMVPPARPHAEGGRTKIATAQDLIPGNSGGIQVQVGDLIGPAGVYWGQGTPALFCLLINPEKVLKAGTNDYLFRGVIVTNDYKGEAAWWIKTMLLRGVCGNHILWDAIGLSSVKIVHRGESAIEKMHHTLEATVTKIIDSSAKADEDRIQAAQKFLIAGTQEEVLDTLFGKRIASRKVLEAAFVEAEGPMEQDPKTAWGFAQGLTSISQQQPYADAKHEIDLAAGKVLELAGVGN